MKMLRSKALLAAMLSFQIFHPGVSTTTVAASSAAPSATPSKANSSTTPSISSVKTSKLNKVSATSSVTPGRATTTVGDQSQGESTVSPTKSVAPSGSAVNQTASASIRYIIWSAWREEKDSDCQAKCCDTGGSVIRQIRNCTILKKRCKGLDKCSDYGVTERDISCYNACAECMPNTGNIEVVTVILLIMTSFVPMAILMTGP